MGIEHGAWSIGKIQDQLVMLFSYWILATAYLSFSDLSDLNDLNDLNN